MKKYLYYIVIETSHSLGWKIRTTINNLDQDIGLQKEIKDLEKEYNSAVIILSWKRLNRSWLNRIIGE